MLLGYYSLAGRRSSRAKLTLKIKFAKSSHSDATEILLEEFQKARAAEDQIPITLEEASIINFCWLATNNWGVYSDDDKTFQEDGTEPQNAAFGTFTFP